MKSSILKSFLTILALYQCVHHGSTASILFFHHIASYSHRVATWPLAEALAARGHQVTYISPQHPKRPNPNITELIPASLEKYAKTFLNDEFDINVRVNKRMERLVNNMFDFGYDGCEVLYNSPEFQAWLQTTSHIDLVVLDGCLSAECGLGLVYKLGAKQMVFSPTTAVAYEYDAWGYVPESSAVPEIEVDTRKRPMNFFGRIANALESLRWRFAHVRYTKRIDKFIREKLKVPEMPYIGDLMAEGKVVLYPGDQITDYPRALPPNFVNIAGMHCTDHVDPLPQNMAEFISTNSGNNETDGFVYISLGSLVISSKLPDRIKQVFFQTIETFPNLKFMWKWNGDFPKDIPKNLLLSKWFPQIDVLGHPKIRAFITQNGRPSSLEALYNGVPMISFPILGDQDFNANRLEETGGTIQLEIGSVTLEELTDAIRKTVYEPETKVRMAKLQKLFRDRPMRPVDLAVWWTEYVLRTDETWHLRPAGHNQAWFVRRQIDVWGFLSISLFIFVCSIVVVVFKIGRILLKKSNPKKIKKK